MRENRTYGSEGGEDLVLPDPYQNYLALWEMYSRLKPLPQNYLVPVHKGTDFRSLLKDFTTLLPTPHGFGM